MFFEPCLVFVYTSKVHNPKFLGRTVVDGKFASLMPFWRNGVVHFNLTSVAHTPLGNFKDSKQARAFCDAFEADTVKMAQKRALFEEEARMFFSNFDQDYEYKGHYISTKTKLYDASANRECICDVIMGGRVMQIFGGKITGMFHAEEAMYSWLGLED